MNSTGRREKTGTSPDNGLFIINKKSLSRNEAEQALIKLPGQDSNLRPIG
jgi:hypothetical protein